jgi:peptide/nickel transport system substrate-binding protein
MFMNNLRQCSGLVLLTLTFLAYSACAPAPKEKPAEPTTFRIGWKTTIPADLHPSSGLLDVATEQIYSHVAWVRYKNGARFDTEPDTVESIEILNGGKTCIIHLKPNLTFHDGKKVTAEDLVFSFSQYTKPENKGDFKKKFFSGITITETASNALKLESKYAQDWGTFFTTPILEKAHELRYAGHLKEYVPIGTGPYKFVSYDEGTKVMKLEAFDNFVGPKPTVPKLEIHYFVSSEAATIAMLQDKVDYLMDVPGWELFSLKRKNSLEFFKAEDHYYIVLWLNTRRPPFTDPKVRRSISMLIDKNKLVADPDGMNGDAIATDAPLHVAFPFTQPVAKSFNPMMAYKTLDEAGWKLVKGRLMKNGDPLKMNIIYSEHNQFLLPTLRILARELEAGGLSVSLQQVVWKTFEDQVLKKKDFSVSMADFADMISLQTNSLIFMSNNPFNILGFSNGRLDALFTSLMHNAPPTIQIKKEIQEILLEQAPIIPLFYKQAYFALNSRFSAHLENIQKDPWMLYYFARPSDRLPLN